MKPAPTRAQPDALARRRAVDPAHSIILEAPAGSGKTRLLVERYLNVLTQVGRPEEILAITFTNKAATEMRDRVMAALATDSAVAVAIRELDQNRGWDLDNRPDRLKIQTIDSFAFSLARRQPVVCAFAAETPIEDATALYHDAAQRLLDRMARDDPHAEDIADFVALLDNDAGRARAFIAEALSKRDQWIGPVAATAGDPARATQSIKNGLQHLRAALTVSLNAALGAALRLAIEGLGEHVAEARNEPWHGLDDPRAWELAAATLLTVNGTPRKRFDRRQGFERQHSAQKQVAGAAARMIADADLAARLAAASRLPREEIDADTQAPLRAIATALTLAVENLNETFAAHGAMDFTELALAANRALVMDDLPTELAQAMDYRIRHVLVDEFQDTSLSQHRLLAALIEGWQIGAGNSFFAVGDPMQSIYRFRDANLREFLNKAAHGFGHWPLERLRLRSNFRSHDRLVDWCNAVFERMFGDQTDPIHGAVAFDRATPMSTEATASSHADETVGVHIAVRVGDPARHGKAQAEVVAARAQLLLEREPEASVAILVRSRAVLDDILPLLRERGLGWRGTDVEPLVDEPVVRDLASLAEVLYSARRADYSRAALAWLALLRSPLVGLELVDLERIASVGVTNDGDELSAGGRRRWQRLNASLAQDRRSLPPRARLERAWLALGGADAYLDEASLANAEQVFELLDAKPALARRPNDLGRELGRLYATDARSTSKLQVMTIHKAKGLEFDHVIVPGLEHVPIQGPRPLLLWRPEGDDVLIAARTQRGPKSLYDWLDREEKAQNANELKRVFYVAATRAARSLTLVGGVETAEPAMRPPKSSLLELLWDLVYDEIEFSADTTSRAERRSRTLSRLPDDYRWSPPVELPFVPRAGGPAVGPKPASTTDDRREIVLGELVHRELKLISDHFDPANYAPSARAPIWARWLAPTGLSQTDAKWTARELARQIDCFLADEQGRWLLQKHTEALSEGPFTSVVNGQTTRMVADRTFVETGTRWIIDYKSSVVRGPQERFIAEHCRRHAPQLRGYAKALAAMSDLPVRTALYFTSIPRLVEIDAEETAKTER